MVVDEDMVLITFQSYLSPIQTPRRAEDPGGVVDFQSYLSPIQTRAVAKADARNVTFNPTLVQFKLRWSQCRY